MKKIYLRTMIVAAILLLCSTANAFSTVINGISYELDSKTASVERNNKYTGNITIPEVVVYEGTTYKVEEISDSAFYNCTSLTSVTIPNSVTSIGEGAFNGCQSLTSIDIPNSVTSIGERAFDGCQSLTSINIPNSVTTIGEGAFSGCQSLTSINIPNSVITIGERAFAGCTSLTSIDIPNSVTTIGESAFSDCDDLKSINIPNSVTSIGERAFFWCTRLKSVTIGNSVTAIDFNTFEGCTSLTDIYCYATTAPQAYGSVFGDLNYTNATLHVPAEAIEEYRNSTPWSDFGSIVALTDKDISLGVNDVESTQLHITVANGFFTINGATEGSVVTVYTASGVAAGKATVTNGTAAIETTIQKGETAIVTAGGKSIKVVAQ